MDQFDVYKKKRAKISELIHPIYNGDFDKALDSLEKESVDRFFDDAAKDFVNYYRYSLRPLPPENSELDKAWKEYYIFGLYLTREWPEALFKNSIEKEEKTRIRAVCDYTDYLLGIHETTAIEQLKKYIKLYGEKTEFLEKAVVLYSFAQDTENLYKTLQSLVGRKSDSKEEIGDMLLRIADCEYRLGYFEKSIKTAEKAFRCGCWINGYAKQMVDSYIALSEYDKARNFMNTLFKSEDSKISEKIYFYLVYKINLHEEKRFDAYRCVYDLNDDVFASNNFFFRDVSDVPHRYAAVIDKYSLNYATKNIKIEEFNLEERYIDYLWAAFITKHLYGNTEKYYEYVSKGLLYEAFGDAALGDLFHGNDYYTYSDKGISCLLSAVKFSHIIDGGKFQKNGHSVKEYAEYLLRKKYPEEKDVVYKWTKYQYVGTPQFKSSSEGNVKDEKLEKYVRNADVMYGEAEEKFKHLLDVVRKNVDFKEDLKDAANAVKNSVLTFESDRKFIEEYLESVAIMDDFYKYDDYLHRVNTLLKTRKALLDTFDMKGGGSKTTMFFDNYFYKVWWLTYKNLENLLDLTRKELSTKIIIDVPITKIVPDESDNVSFSVKISNAENRAPAKKMFLSVENTEGKQIFCKDLSEKNLIGGASISELITIQAESKDAFDIKIIVSYDRGSVEKSVQLTVDAGKFEEIRNPYNTGNPVVKDEMFFGRNELIERLTTSLKDDTTRCVIIYGQKRSGKSSIFKHLKNKLEDKFIVLDFTAGSDITNEQNFYRCVSNELSAYMEDNDFDSKTIEKFEDFDVSDYLGFEKFLRKAKREICRPADKELLLMIDEFTQIYNYIKEEHAFTENFMDKWKAMSEQNLFKSALIGQDNMPEFIRAYPNQFQVTEPVRVSYLEREYAVELINKPILLDNGKSRFLDGAEEKIADWFNGQPYYIQCYCKRLVEYLNLKKENYITTAVAEKIKKDLLGEANTMQLFDNLVEKDDFNSWNVLKKIASSDVEDVLLDLASLSDSEKAALNKLTVRDVVNTKQGRYQIKIPFFREWIREYK